MSVVDRMLRRLGLQRLPQQTRNQFTGAQFSRLMSAWVRAPLSADAELSGDFAALRGRSRDLARNNPYGKRFVRMARTHVVGPKGVQFRPDVRFGSGRPYDVVNERIDEAWEDWCRPAHASANGRLSFPQIQRLAISEWASCGEALFLVRYDRAYKYGLALQPIDADRLDHEFSRPANPRTGEAEVRMGVEVSETGAPLAYHILRVHPSEIGIVGGREQARQRIPAAQVLHLYTNDERVELTRGVPPLAVAMRDLRHLDGFQEAALVKMRTSAAAMGFIITKSPDGDVTTPDEGLEFTAEAGVMRELGLGQEFQGWDPSEPATSYPEFTRAVLRSIAAGLGTSYAMMANDLSDANYSSMRTGRLEEQETWQELQAWFIDQFLDRVFDLWFPSAVLSGALQLPLAERERDFTAHRWLARRWSSVDPVKDVEADERRIALGLISRQAIAARDGEDLWENMEHIQEEEGYALDLGIDITPKTAGGMTNAGTDVAAGTAAHDAGAGGRGGSRPAGRGRRPDPDFAVVGGTRR